MKIIACCSICFISDSLKLLKEIIYVYVSHCCHMPRHQGHENSSIWEGSISFSGRNNIFSVCWTYTTTVYELFKSHMGIVEDLGGMIVCNNPSKFYFFF